MNINNNQMGNCNQYYYEQINVYIGESEQILYDKLIATMSHNKSIRIVVDIAEKKRMFTRNPIEHDRNMTECIYAIYTSPNCGFEDEMLFQICKNDNIYIRAISMSRIGCYDFNKNEEHIEDVLGKL